MSDLRREVKRRGRQVLIDFYRGERLVGCVMKVTRGRWFSWVFGAGDGHCALHRARWKAIRDVEQRA